MQGGVRLLLDYGAEPACLLHYWPLCADGPPVGAPGPSCIQQKDWWHLRSRTRLALPDLGPAEASAISAVLVSSAEAMLALPLLTERTGFRGAVYATYAALQLGTQLMLEFARMHGGADAAPPSDAPGPAAPAPVSAYLHSVWARGLPTYTELEARSCAARVAAVSYAQSVRLSPDASLVAAAYPSGISIGGASWSVETYGARYALVADPACVPTPSGGPVLNAARQVDPALFVHLSLYLSIEIYRYIDI